MDSYPVYPSAYPQYMSNSMNYQGNFQGSYPGKYDQFKDYRQFKKEAKEIINQLDTLTDDPKKNAMHILYLNSLLKMIILNCQVSLQRTTSL